MQISADELIRNKTIIRSSRKTLSMEVKDGTLIIRTPRFTSVSSIDRFIERNRNWIDKQCKKLEKLEKNLEGVKPLSEKEKEELRQKARIVFKERADYYAAKVGVTYSAIQIRFQKSRWGSCSAKGSLSFNALLLLAPPEALDSVVVHELCHRKEMNHSARFYREVLKVYPDYYKWNKWLKDNGKLIMARDGK